MWLVWAVRITCKGGVAAPGKLRTAFPSLSSSPTGRWAHIYNVAVGVDSANSRRGGGDSADSV